MRFLIGAILTVSIIAIPTAAQAKETPPDKGIFNQFSPQFDNSPVNVVFCMVPNACRF